MSNNQRILSDLAVECTQALFRHYTVELSHLGDATPDQIWAEELVLAGIIGFTSDRLRGSLVLAMGHRSLLAVEEQKTLHREWVKEFSNQLLGRMKNRLLSSGIDLHMSTPLSMHGVKLVLEPSSEESAPLLFHTPDHGAVCVLMDAEVQTGFELSESTNEDNVCADEGALLLF